MVKKCPKCELEKPDIDFRHHSHVCKDCWRLYQKEWRHRDLKGFAARQMRYFRKHKYGMLQEEFDCRFEIQEGKCAICKKPFDRTPHIDHDHETGLVRGLLCNRCNAMLGFADDDDNILSSAATYLRGSRNFPGMIFLIRSQQFIPSQEKNSVEAIKEENGSHDQEFAKNQ